MGDGGAGEKRCHEADQPDDGDFGQLGTDDSRVQFRAGQEGEQDGAGGGQELQPLLVGTEAAEPAEMLRDRRHDDAHADLDEGDGDAQPVSDDGRNDRQGQPEGGDREELLHGGVLLVVALWALWSRTQEPSAPGGAFKGGLHPQGHDTGSSGGRANRAAGVAAAFLRFTPWVR